jgi:hypothetical protein
MHISFLHENNTLYFDGRIIILNVAVLLKLFNTTLYVGIYTINDDWEN